ncbi:hypothetical protein [Methylobacterium mesophilicum]|uniref:hypothetical protein n=1 Tax=Methylobacterium mesophilicum TaxID=39956 RepID=UPI002F3036DF
MNLLITGQIRNVAAFDEQIRHVRKHRPVFEKVAFATWTQEILHNAEPVANASDVFTMLDAGNILPVTPLINRDILSFIAQFRQLACGFSHFNDNRPILRVRADDADICGVDLTELIAAVSADWSRRRAVTTVVKGAARNIPCFLDDRLFILSPDLISKLQRLSLASFLDMPQNNIFPEFLIYSQLFLGISPDLDTILRGDILSLQNEIHGPPSYRRKLPREVLVRGLEDYGRILKYRVAFFADVLTPSLQKLSGFHSYITAVERDMGPSTMTGLQSAVEEMIQAVRKPANIPVPAQLGTHARTVENQRTYLKHLFARRDYAGVQRARALMHSDVITDPSSREQIGISLFYLGEKPEAYDLLRSLFDEGSRSFHSLFYISALAVERRDQDLVYKALLEILKFHSGRRDAMDHVLNCAFSLDSIDERRTLADRILQHWSTEVAIVNKAAALIGDRAV